MAELPPLVGTLGRVDQPIYDADICEGRWLWQCSAAVSTGSAAGLGRIELGDATRLRLRAQMMELKSLGGR